MKQQIGAVPSQPPCRRPHVTRAIENRLRRLQGQVAGIERMLSEQRSCEEVLTQIAAMKQAANGLATELLTAHIVGCLGTPGEPDGDDRAVVRRVRAAVRSVLKHA